MVKNILLAKTFKIHFNANGDDYNIELGLHGWDTKVLRNDKELFVVSLEIGKITADKMNTIKIELEPGDIKE